MKAISVAIAFVVSAGIVAGLANDVQDLAAYSQHGTPIPQCELISVLRPVCR
jgi:hypothetical protein